MAYLAWAFDAYISAKLYAGETIVWLRDGFVIPYRRGCVFHGPPGTGKTSLYKAITNEWSLELYQFKLVGMDEKELMHMHQARPKRDTIVSVSSPSSVTVGAGGKENKILLPPKKTRVTLSNLLNVLDGLGSKEGYIATITVNAPKSLDPALYRAGRIDIRIYLGFSTKVIAAIIYTRILGDDKRSRFS
ncbi:hypothetical protein SLS59_004842 [Nothophoma quercina]|uniref:ATPase AAA-type core domain-containing protein n=1 Tax=Nothophoma quercina TaxID=749835 RepID=A0ABR3RE10_9PLEO